jgi:hypothetical protein
VYRGAGEICPGSTVSNLNLRVETTVAAIAILMAVTTADGGKKRPEESKKMLENGDSTSIM